MSVLVQLEVAVNPGSAETLRQILADLFPDTRAYDGCIDITAYLSEDEKTVIFIENWESKEHYGKYLAWREETGSLAALGEHVQGPPNIRYFNVLDA